MAGVTGYQDEYLFLNVKRGKDVLIDVHDRLYTAPLAKHRSREHTFVPHMTLGRLPTPVAFRHALDVARKTSPSLRLTVTDLYACRLPDVGELAG